MYFYTPHLSFLILSIVHSILFFRFVTIRVYQNKTVDISHLTEYIVITWRMYKHQYVTVKYLLTHPARSAFLWMSVSTNRYHQHLTWELSQHQTNPPQYVPTTESKLILFSKIAVYSSILVESISASFCPVPHNL